MHALFGCSKSRTDTKLLILEGNVNKTCAWLLRLSVWVGPYYKYILSFVVNTPRKGLLSALISSMTSLHGDAWHRMCKIFMNRNCFVDFHSAG